MTFCVDFKDAIILVTPFLSLRSRRICVSDSARLILECLSLK